MDLQRFFDSDMGRSAHGSILRRDSPPDPAVTMTQCPSQSNTRIQEGLDILGFDLYVSIYQIKETWKNLHFILMGHLIRDKSYVFKKTVRDNRRLCCNLFTGASLLVVSNTQQLHIPY